MTNKKVVEDKHDPRFERVDPRPVEWPVGVDVPETLEQKIARMVRTSVSQAAASQGAETFDEADDFDIEDDDFPSSGHELDDDQELLMRDLQERRRIPQEVHERVARARAMPRDEDMDHKTLDKSPGSPGEPVDKKGGAGAPQQK